MQETSCQELHHDFSGSIATHLTLATWLTSTPLDINLICPVQMTEALKIVPGNQKVEVAGSASSSPIKNLISIPGSN